MFTAAEHLLIPFTSNLPGLGERDKARRREEKFYLSTFSCLEEAKTKFTLRTNQVSSVIPYFSQFKLLNFLSFSGIFPLLIAPFLRDTGNPPPTPGQSKG